MRELHDDEPVLVIAPVEEDRLLRGAIAPVRRRIVERRVSRSRGRLRPSWDGPWCGGKGEAIGSGRGGCGGEAEREGVRGGERGANG